MSRRILLVVVLAMLLALASGCVDEPGGNGCWTTLVQQGSQLVCPEKPLSVDAVIIEQTVERAQNAYSGAVDKASAAYGQAVQGSRLQQAAGAMSGK